MFSAVGRMNTVTGQDKTRQIEREKQQQQQRNEKEKEREKELEKSPSEINRTVNRKIPVKRKLSTENCVLVESHEYMVIIYLLKCDGTVCVCGV